MENKQRRKQSKYARFMSLRVLTGLSGQRTVFPFYHVVSDHPGSHIRHLYPCRSEKEFTADMECLLKYFQPVSIDEYLDGKQSGKRKMVLSFDDGLVECHRFIAPFLKSRGIPAIFFLNNDFIDNRGLFFRYLASMLIDHVEKEKFAASRASEFLAIPEQQVREAILMISYRQQPLLDALAMEMNFDPAARMRDEPVYMSTEQVKDLAVWGFHLGAHSTDHPEFFKMEPRQMELQVHKSMKDIMKRFGSRPACFAFPFTSDGVPREVIDHILDEGIAEVLFGTAGLKITGRRDFIQRIPMEPLGLPAGRVLRTEYLTYVVKGLIGRNHYFRKTV